MASLVNGLDPTAPLAGSRAARPVTDAEEAHLVTAILCAFLAGGVALTVHALSVAAAWGN